MTKQTFTIDLRTAVLIRQAFLPRNPNKLRAADPEVVRAAHRYIHEINRLAAMPVAENAPATEVSDQYVISMCSGLSHVFGKCFEGKWKEQGFASQSEADFFVLKFLTHDADSDEQVIRIFKASPLYREDKSPDYIQRTLAKIKSEA